jgi:hypothetical protein
MTSDEADRRRKVLDRADQIIRQNRYSAKIKRGVSSGEVSISLHATHSSLATLLLVPIAIIGLFGFTIHQVNKD